jgi:transposase-like protein
VTGRPSLLTPELIEIAEEAAAAGGAISTIAAACGVHVDTVTNWTKAHRDGKGSELHEAFFKAIQRGQHQAELRAVRKICEFADSRDAQWWLTHNPRTRQTWSDAAATRREIDRVLGQVAKGILESRLPDDQKSAVMLSIRAQGLQLDDPATDDASS